MREYLDVVYASDHSYIFFCCVSILSLMEQLPEHQKIRLHLLLDESFCEEDRRLLKYLTDSYENLTLVEHRISEAAFDSRDFKDSLWSRAACYRLILPSLLANVDFCLYIDSDTLVVGDILPLWEMDMTDYYLAGVYDDISPVRDQTVGCNIPGIETYINSGVLFMNLSLMREHGIQKKLLEGVTDYLVVDQDLLNVACYGRIRLLPSDYNCIPGVHAESPRILHFLLRDYLRPWRNRRARDSEAWWRCAEAFRELYDLEGLRKEADWYQRGSILAMFRRCADFDRVYVVGSGSDADRIARALRLGKCRGLKGTLPEDGRVENPAGSLLIVASRKKKIPLLNHFLAGGGSEEQLFFFNRRPVSFYNLVPPACKREVYGELLMWEFGVDARGVATLSALLEINAARYPDKEALICRDSTSRRSVSWRSLNKMANRMADWLAGQRIPRGTRVGLTENGMTSMPGGQEPPGEAFVLPEEGVTHIQELAAILGIIKAGCCFCPAEDSTRDRMKEDAAEGSRQGILKADVSALQNERLSDKGPAAETLPEEPALACDGLVLTNRQLCEEAEDLRRRIGWHAGDGLLICRAKPSGTAGGEARQHRLMREMTAALAYGRPVVIVPETEAGEIWSIAEKEAVTLISLDDIVSRKVWKDLKNRQAEVPGSALDTSTIRMILTEAEPPEEWQKLIPHIPVNGQGYDRAFRYDSEWYA